MVQTGPPPPAGDPRADAVAELRWAMSGPGLSPDKLPLLKTVLSLPVLLAAMERAEGRPAMVAAYEAVADAARQLGNTPDARLLRAGLAVDYGGDARHLTLRRAEFRDQHNASGSPSVLPDSDRSLYDVETRMLGALVTLLGAGQPAAAPGEPWYLDAFEVTMRFRRRVVEVAEVVDDVVSRQDGLPSYDKMYFCTSDAGEPAQLRVLDGGRVVNDRAQGRENCRVATIAFPEPLKAGAKHRVWSEVNYPAKGDESEPWVVVNVIRPYRRIVIRLQFEPGCQPEHVWRVDGLIPDARGGDRETSEPLRSDPFGCVETEFLDPHLSRCYGIAWQW